MLSRTRHISTTHKRYIRMCGGFLNKTATNRETYYKHLYNKDETENIKPNDWDVAKPFDEIPGPKPLPLIGNMFRFVPIIGDYSNLDLLNIHRKLRHDFGNIAVLKGIFTRRPVVILFEPEDFETMFRNEGVWPHRRAMECFAYYREHIRNDFVALLQLEGEQWFKFRSIVNPILMQPRMLQKYTKEIDQVTEDFVKHIAILVDACPEGIMPDNFANEINKWSLESVGTVGLDTRLGCLNGELSPDSEAQILIDSIHTMFHLTYKLEIRPSLWKLYNTKDWLLYVQCMDTITDIIIKHIETAIEDIEGNNGNGTDETSILQRLLRKDKKVAVAMAMDLIMAGIDTTGKTLAAALYYLARYPDKQQILRAELNGLLSTKDAIVTNDVLTRAPYLKAVIKETTRLAPIAVGSFRTSVKDMVLGGYQIPKGTDVLASNVSLATTDEYFVNGYEFIPERWLRNSGNEEISHKNIHPFISLPFGFGPRSCIGKRLANLELEVAIAKITRNFRLNWPHDAATFGTDLLYGIKSPLKLQLAHVATQ